MKGTIALSMILAGAMLMGGCATKKYVQQTATPIQTKVDQVADQSNKQGTDIEAAKKDLERHETGINAAKERAMSAEKAAGDAMNKATEAGSTATEARNMAQKNGQDLNTLRDNVQNTLGNLDDYKLAAETVIPFGFNKDTLTKDAKDQLDQFVKEHGTAKRYFITVEGYTDKTGTKAYNDALSQRRAERVMRYLIAQENIPLFRVQLVGLGNEKPADTGRNRAARAKNRRVEVRMFSADQALTLAQKQAQ
ncbi:MAG TPA: OmpA family protein [Bryobacteraceae bacterium]|nr:OmpA family protein [Bryobacteraceae bacterium]